ncbi:MAG: type IV secretion system protein [Alphaproteobacteria bacterium]|nr:type IV secretion system protein [Alphaproteobacteria bacterium]
MTKRTKIKKFLISALSCILLVCALCMVSSDASARNPGCSWSKRCYPGCKYTKVESCTLCPLFVLVFNTVSKVGSLSAKNFSDGIIQIVVVFFGVWLAMEVIKFVASMKTKDLKDFVQTLITKGFTIILVVTILKTGVGNFYNIFIQPVYNTAQSMARIMFEESNNIGTHEDDKKAKKDKSITGIKEIENGLPSSIGVSIVTTMTMMENRVRMIKALGSSLVCSSFQDAWIPIIPKFKYLIYGGSIWLLTVAMIIVIPFLMIDAVFELGVATLLMPFAVGAYAFNYTRKYCKKVWDTFLNSAMSFLFTSIVVLILLGALQTATQENIGSMNGFDQMFVMGGSGDNIYSSFKEAVDWRSPMFLNLVFIFLLAWAVLNMGKDFANEIASSLSPEGIGAKLGGQIGSMAQGAALKATAPLRSAAGVGVQAVNRLAGRGIAKARTGIMKRRMENNKDKQVTNADGSKSVTIRGKTYTMDKDGNITRDKRKEKKRGDRKRVVTEKEIRTDGVIIKRKIITIMEKKDDKWVEVRQRTVDRMRITRNIDIINRDGTININGMDKLLAGTSGEVKDALMKNMNRVIIEARLSKAAFDPENEVQPGSEKTYMDNETGEMITEYKTQKGDLVVSRTKINREKGIAETRVTRIDAEGKVMVFESDGLRNKMTTMLLKKDADVENISLDQIRNIEDLCQTDQSGNVLKNVAFAYTEHSKKRIAAGVDERNIDDGMFEKDITSGAFKKYMDNARTDTSFAGKSDGSSNYGKTEKDERVRRQKGEGVVEYLGRRGRERQQLWKEKKSLRQERRARRATMREDFRKNKENLKNLHNEKINEIDQDLRKNMQEIENYEEAKIKYRKDRWKEWNNNRKARKELRQERREQRREIRQDFLDRRQKSKENFLGRDKVRRNKRKLNGGWFGGNDYSLREANMNFYFAGSKSPRSLKRAIRGIFGWQ